MKEIAIVLLLLMMILQSIFPQCPGAKDLANIGKHGETPAVEESVVTGKTTTPKPAPTETPTEAHDDPDNYAGEEFVP